MKYFLVGYMACGKSFAGKVMAKRKGLPFIDLDAYIVKQEGKTISAIFAEKGETGFRELETHYLHLLSERKDDFVMATGGGVPCFNGNMDYMNTFGHTIFLRTDVDIITRRLIRGKIWRPMVRELEDHEIHDFVCRHLEQRLPFYNQAKEIIDRYVD